MAIVSGNGGTGKTVIAAAFGTLAKRAIIADCDVDAADLHLLLKPRVREGHEFKAGQVAVIDEDLCKRCGECIRACRFDAIDPDFVVDPISCEGCGFCAHICLLGAIRVVEKTSCEWFVSDTRLGTLVHAQLGIGEANSGKLVALIRRRARELAQEGNFDWIIIDGPPGIGCPVIASLSGVDCAVVVT